MKRTGTTNQVKSNLISELRKLASQKNIPLWKRVAYDLELPTRKNRIVNLSRINRVTKENDVIVVPGKVLGDGSLDHKLTIAAYSFSKNALDRINETKAKAVLLKDFIKDDVKGKKVRLIG